MSMLLSVEIWNLWLREYGARGAIRLALTHGYTHDDIRRVNAAARSASANIDTSARMRGNI